jgi:hypothetical protein
MVVKEKNEVEVVPKAGAVTQNGNVLLLLDKAVAQLSTPNAPAAVEALTKLVDLYERLESKNAKTQFAVDLAAFQGECPPIPKKSTARIATKGGSQFSYRYAELDTIANVIRPYMTKFGFSYTWDSKVNGECISCMCTLQHRSGHQQSALFESPIDKGMVVNDTQKHAAALTYAKRQSLIQILGLTTCDPDSDGAQGAMVSQEQANTLKAKITELGVNEQKFLAIYDIKSATELPENLYGAAIRALETKRRAKQ